MKKLYILVRKDLSPAYQAVQAGHTVAEWMINGTGEWQNQTLVYLHVKNEEHIRNWMYKLQSQGLVFT